MFEPIILGLLTGVFLGLGFGSVFFALIQDSISYGWRTGLKITAGVVTGDFLLIAIALAGTSFLPNIPHFGVYTRIVGAALLIILGITNFRRSPAKPPKIGKTRLGNYLFFFVKGFLLNVLNPGNFLWWVATSAALKTYKYEFYEEVIFFVTCVLTIFATEAAISYYSNRLKDRFSQETIHKFKIGTSFVFFIVAIKLIYDVFVKKA